MHHLNHELKLAADLDPNGIYHQAGVVNAFKHLHKRARGKIVIEMEEEEEVEIHEDMI